mmetsp:Transcript_9988/g.21971  ORF Transcript_9988/g.21971 Transcript_9988/m.21971 type:complete len:330 (-) Transcript_9988:1094-2083(-)
MQTALGVLAQLLASCGTTLLASTRSGHVQRGPGHLRIKAARRSRFWHQGFGRDLDGFSKSSCRSHIVLHLFEGDRNRCVVPGEVACPLNVGLIFESSNTKSSLQVSRHVNRISSGRDELKAIVIEGGRFWIRGSFAGLAIETAKIGGLLRLALRHWIGTSVVVGLQVENVQRAVRMAVRNGSRSGAWNEAILARSVVVSRAVRTVTPILTDVVRSTRVRIHVRSRTDSILLQHFGIDHPVFGHTISDSKCGSSLLGPPHVRTAIASACPIGHAQVHFLPGLEQRLAGFREASIAHRMKIKFDAKIGLDNRPVGRKFPAQGCLGTVLTEV